jgi:hypothetical protein
MELHENNLLIRVEPADEGRVLVMVDDDTWFEVTPGGARCLSTFLDYVADEVDPYLQEAPTLRAVA